MVKIHMVVRAKEEEAKEVDMVATATVVKEVMVAAREAMVAKEVMGVVMVKIHMVVRAKEDMVDRVAKAGVDMEGRDSPAVAAGGDSSPDLALGPTTRAMAGVPPDPGATVRGVVPDLLLTVVVAKEAMEEVLLLTVMDIAKEATIPERDINRKRSIALPRQWQNRM